MFIFLRVINLKIHFFHFVGEINNMGPTLMKFEKGSQRKSTKQARKEPEHPLDVQHGRQTGPNVTSNPVGC